MFAFVFGFPFFAFASLIVNTGILSPSGSLSVQVVGKRDVASAASHLIPSLLTTSKSNSNSCKRHLGNFPVLSVMSSIYGSVSWSVQLANHDP